MKLIKILALCGMLSPLLYTFLWILGGIIVPGYSHIGDDVSSLYAVDAHKRWLFQSLFIVGSILLFVFYLGFHRGLDNGSGSMLAPVFFVLSSFLGVIVACFFPLDAGGEIASWRGKMHLGLIALSGVLLIPAMVLLYVRLRFAEGLQGFAIFSLVTAPVTLILVIVMSFFTGSRYMGLVERFMVSAYQIYYFVSGLVIFLRN